MPNGYPRHRKDPMVAATEPRLYCVGGSLAPGDAEVDLVAPDGAPPGPWTAESGYRWCERIAASHHENFPVASRFLPTHLRPHVAAIYAFARTADDFADEPRFEGRRTQSLDAWEALLEGCYHREVQHPVFIALRDTVRAHNIPIGPLQALLTSFRMDLVKHRYGTFRELLDLCAHSANPVGQLVLLVHGHREPELHRFSDEVCSALQLANFLQDLSVDIPRGRVYLPVEDLEHFGVRTEDLLAQRPTRELAELLHFEIARVRAMFHRGRPLVRKVSPGLSMELDATWRGGMAILDRVEALGASTLVTRPTLGRGDMAGIAARSLVSFGRRFLRGDA
ncbi:MAG: squalene synthase HpnC [Myxococcales bacterium]|nr:squalene synthase HpnC [Myxococcales bacterium]